MILSEPGYEKNSVAQFALGICHLRAGESLSAIPKFELALQLLKSTPAATPSTMKGVQESNETYIRLVAALIENKTYLTPMDADFCKSFPKAAEQVTLLAMIHAYLQSSAKEQDPNKKRVMIEQAKRLSSGLTGQAFDEYKKKLAEGNSA